jgi:hypothetical protein
MPLAAEADLVDEFERWHFPLIEVALQGKAFQEVKVPFCSRWGRESSCSRRYTFLGPGEKLALLTGALLFKLLLAEGLLYVFLVSR